MSAGSWGEIFAGDRGRLLVALLLGELGAAVTGTAYSTVLPIASAELHGAGLYGATLVAGSFATLLVLATGVGPLARLSPRGALALGTLLFVAGVALGAGAIAMWQVLLGMVVRGLAAGLLAGLELTAVGALYDDGLRPRVVGLFAIVWLLPSVAGPVANSLLTMAVSWRLALAWPVVLVVASRVMVGRRLDLVPWHRETSGRLAARPALALLAGLVLAACAPAVAGTGGAVLLLAGLALAAAASVAVLARRLGDDPPRLRRMLVFAVLCLTFFGGHQLASLAAIEGLGDGVVTAAVTVGAAQAAWSLLGLRRRQAFPFDDRVVGLALVAAALVIVAAVLLARPGGGMGRVALVGGWTVAGVGMGLAYRELFSDGLAGLPTEAVSTAAVALTFAELAATTIGSLGVGGWYSLGHVDGIAAHESLGGAYLLLGVVAAGAGVAAWRESGRRAGRAGPTGVRPAPDATLAPWSEH